MIVDTRQSGDPLWQTIKKVVHPDKMDSVNAKKHFKKGSGIKRAPVFLTTNCLAIKLCDKIKPYKKGGALHMARKMFTEEQVQRMRANPYTLKVSTTQITFTKAFKEEFWHRYQEGDTPRRIMHDLGYDPQVLGDNRLSGIQNVVCQQASLPEGFHEGALRKSAEPFEEDSTQGQLRRMQHQLKYLEQEMEFLKKYSLQKILGSEGRSHE